MIAGGIILAVFFLKPSPSTVTVASADGKFELEIPPSALEETDLLKEISVARVSAEDEHGAPVMMYKLSPEGLIFNEPVKFTATIDIEPGDVPFGFHIDITTGSITAIENYDAMLDYGRKAATITGTIDHFSYVFIRKFGVGALLVHPKSDLLVGRTREFDVSLTAGKEGDTHLIKGKDFTVKYTRKGDVTVDGRLLSQLIAKTEAINFILTPGYILDVIPKGRLVPGATARGSGIFTCVGEGLARVDFNFHLNAMIETEWIGESFLPMMYDSILGTTAEVSTEGSTFGVAGEGYNCIGASNDPAQQTTTAPKEETATDSKESSGTGAKICGGIFGPCDEKK